MRTIVLASLAIAVFALLQPVLAWLRVLGFRLNAAAAARRAAVETLPAELAPMFDHAARELEALGFTRSHAQWTDSIQIGELARPGQVFAHPYRGTMAVVTPPVFGNGRRLYSVAFVTAFRSGHVLTTVDGLLHLTPLVPRSSEWRDDCVHDVARQWTAHEAAVRARVSDAPVRLAADEFVRLECETLAGCIEAGLSSDALRLEAPGVYRLTAGYAWRFAARTRAGAHRVALAERRAAPAREPADAWIAADVYAFTAHESRQSLVRGRGFKAALFLASALVSALAIGLLFSWRFVPILIAVLLIHELGHLAGMRLFGFRDRQILFLPLIGAAAIGRKDDASAAQRLVVLLLGPVPGIAIGFAAVYLGNVSGSAWLREFGFASLVLNYLNLLPVAALDGGRVVELLFLQRAPRAGVVFLLASGVLAGLAGLAFDDFVLVALSLVLLAATPARWRTAMTVRDALTHVSSEAPRSERVRAAFTALDRRLGRLSSQARQQLARAVVEHLDTRPAARTLVLAGGAVYALLLAAPIGGALRFLVPRPEVRPVCVSAEDALVAEHDSLIGGATLELCPGPESAGTPSAEDGP